MEPSLISDVALPTTAVGIVLLVINTIFNRIIEYRKIKNGGTEPAKTVAVLERIEQATLVNGAKLEALKHIDTRIEAGVGELKLYNTTAAQMAQAHERGRVQGIEEAERKRYSAQ